MTKFIDKTGVKVKKKTRFLKHINFDMETSEAKTQPKHWDYVELIRRRDNLHEFDLFVAYDEENEGNYEHWFLGEAGDEFEEDVE